MNHYGGKKPGLLGRLTKSLVDTRQSASLDSIGYSPSFGRNLGLTNSRLLLGGKSSKNDDDGSQIDDMSSGSNAKGRRGSISGSSSSIGGGSNMSQDGSKFGGSNMDQGSQDGGSTFSSFGGSSMQQGSRGGGGSKSSKKGGSGPELGVTSGSNLSNSKLVGLGSKTSSTGVGGSGSGSGGTSGPLGSGSNLNKGPSSRSGQFGEPTKSAIDAKKIADQEKEKEKIIPVCNPKTWRIDMDSLKSGVTVLDTNHGITIVGNASGLPPGPEPGTVKRLNSGLKSASSGGSYVSGTEINKSSGTGSDLGKNPSGSIGGGKGSTFGSTQDNKGDDPSKTTGSNGENDENSDKSKPCVTGNEVRCRQENYEKTLYDDGGNNKFFPAQKKPKYARLQDENPLSECKDKKSTLVKCKENQSNGGDPTIPSDEQGNLGAKSKDSLTLLSSTHLRYNSEVADTFQSVPGANSNSKKPNSKGQGSIEKISSTLALNANQNADKPLPESKIPVLQNSTTTPPSTRSKVKSSSKSRSKNSKVSFDSMNGGGNVRRRSNVKSGLTPNMNNNGNLLIEQPFVEVKDGEKMPPDAETRLKMKVKGKAYNPNQTFFHSYYEVGPTKLWPAERAPEDLSKMYSRPAGGKLGVPATAPPKKVQKRQEEAEKNKLKPYYKIRSQKIPFEGLYFQGKCVPKPKEPPEEKEPKNPYSTENRVLTGVAPPDRFTFDMNKHRAVKYFSGRKLVPDSKGGSSGNGLVLDDDSPEVKARKIEKAMLPEEYVYIYRKECPPDRIEPTLEEPSEEPLQAVKAEDEDDDTENLESEYGGDSEGEDDFEDGYGDGGGGEYDDFGGPPDGSGSSSIGGSSMGGGSYSGSQKSSSNKSKNSSNKMTMSDTSSNSNSAGSSRFGSESQSFGASQNSAKSMNSNTSSKSTSAKGSSKSKSKSSAQSAQSDGMDEITFDFGPDD